jgi:hypothetical protein
MNPEDNTYILDCVDAKIAYLLTSPFCTAHAAAAFVMCNQIRSELADALQVLSLREEVLNEK